jgi:hypothetical protein
MRKTTNTKAQAGPQVDLDAISFDDMLGDGLQEMQEETEEVEDIDDDVDEVDEEEEEIDTEPRDYDEDDPLADPQDDEDEEEEDDEDVEDDNSVSIISEIAGTLGYELNDEYEETTEGLTSFVKDVAQNIAEDQLQQLFSQFPEVQQHLDYVLAGGDPKAFFEAFNPQNDFAEFELAQDDRRSQKAILFQYFKAKGHDDEFAQESINDFEETGKLYDKALRAKKSLADSQNEYRKQLIEEQKQIKAQEQRQVQEFWNKVAETIESENEFAGIRIPDKRKAEFFNYISTPIGPNGETKRDLDYQKAELDTKIAIDYLLFNGFNLKDVIETKARTKSVQSLRDRIVNNEQKAKSAAKYARKSREFNSDNLDLGALFQ